MKGEKVTAVVFLDVDGVLNTQTTCVYAPSGTVGVDKTRIDILSKAMKETWTDGVVLTSTWKYLREDNEDYIYLVKSLRNYGISLLGKTQEERTGQRAAGILDYLEEHPLINDFVILDDQRYGFDLNRILWESYIDTQGRGIEHSVLASKTPSIHAMLFHEAIQKYSKEQS